MTARDDCESCGATSADKCVCGVHSCSYECDRPACVRRQRDELRDKMYSRDDKKAALPEPDFIGVSKDGIPQGKCYSLAQLESYAAARVAEATAELQGRVAELEANDRRYRWLRDGNDDKTSSYARDLANKHYGFEWDRIIDADILAGSEGGKA